MYLYNGKLASNAAAFATARLTANIAFAPNLLLFAVPSSSHIMASIPVWSATSQPTSVSAKTVFTLFTAFKTDLPP